MLFKYVVNIFEPKGVGMDYPVVQHVFIGKTQREALGYYHAHLKTDAFLRACAIRKRFDGFECLAQAHWEQED